MKKNKNKNKKLLKWFKDQGVLKRKGNLYVADRAFMAHSAVNWIKKRASQGLLDTKEIEENMSVIRLFLQKKVDLMWEDGIINVVMINSEEDTDNESNRLEASNGEQR